MKVRQVDYGNRFTGSEIYKDEDSDCTVVSLGILLEIPYDEAHAIMAEFGGRKPRKGGWSYMVAEAMPSVFEPVKGLEGRGVTLSQFCQAHQHGRYWVASRTHAMAVKNGVIHDHFRRVRLIVEAAYKVNRQAYMGPWRKGTENA